MSPAPSRPSRDGSCSDSAGTASCCYAATGCSSSATTTAESDRRPPRAVGLRGPSTPRDLRRPSTPVGLGRPLATALAPTCRPGRRPSTPVELRRPSTPVQLGRPLATVFAPTWWPGRRPSTPVELRYPPRAPGAFGTVISSSSTRSSSTAHPAGAAACRWRAGMSVPGSSTARRGSWWHTRTGWDSSIRPTPAARPAATIRGARWRTGWAPTGRCRRRERSSRSDRPWRATGCTCQRSSPASARSRSSRSISMSR